MPQPRAWPLTLNAGRGQTVGRATRLRPVALIAADVPANAMLLSARTIAGLRQAPWLLRIGASGRRGDSREVSRKVSGRARLHGQSSKAVEVGDGVDAPRRAGTVALDAVELPGDSERVDRFAATVDGGERLIQVAASVSGEAGGIEPGRKLVDLFRMLDQIGEDALLAVEAAAFPTAGNRGFLSFLRHLELAAIQDDGLGELLVVEVGDRLHTGSVGGHGALEFGLNEHAGVGRRSPWIRAGFDERVEVDVGLDGGVGGLEVGREVAADLVGLVGQLGAEGFEQGSVSPVCELGRIEVGDVWVHVSAQKQCAKDGAFGAGGEGLVGGRQQTAVPSSKARPIAWCSSVPTASATSVASHLSPAASR